MTCKVEISEALCRNIGTNDEPFSKKEHFKVKCKIRTGKSQGEDGITSELLKYGDVDDIILDLCNEALTTGEQP